MLAWLLDAAYLMFLAAVSPWLIYRRIAQKKPVAGLGVKLTGNIHRQHRDRPCVWFHAVSVGEVLQLQAVITRMMARYPAYEMVITTTTGTGFDVARSKYPGCTVRFFPLDFSWAVRRAMKTLRPKLIVLVELELWPNFLAMARHREIPVAIINGRISDPSFRTYQRFAWLTRPLLESCSLIAVQSLLNAERFLHLGAPPARLFQTGNIKFDGIETNRDNPKSADLRQYFGIQPDELVFLAGSTQSPEEDMALSTWQSLRNEFPHLRLLLVPRHKERFAEVAELIAARGHQVLRRSAIREQRSGMTVPSTEHPVPSTQYRVLSTQYLVPSTQSSGHEHPASHPRTPAPPHPHTSSGPHPSPLTPQPILLLDTLGELSHAWGLADIAFVGGSLTNRGGQNMIEPAGFGAAVLFGPNTWNFRDVTEALLTRDAAVVIRDGEELTSTVRRLLNDESSRRRLGDAARQFVLSQQGATDRTVDLLGRMIGATSSGETRSVKAA